MLSFCKTVGPQTDCLGLPFGSLQPLSMGHDHLPAISPFAPRPSLT